MDGYGPEQLGVCSIVRVATQPSNQCVTLVGTVGIIVEMSPNGEYSRVQAISSGGRMAGEGTVPTACLIRETREEWLRAGLLRLADSIGETYAYAAEQIAKRMDLEKDAERLVDVMMEEAPVV